MDADVLRCVAKWRCSGTVRVFDALNTDIRARIACSGRPGTTGVVGTLHASIAGRVARWPGARAIAVRRTFDAGLCAFVAHGFCAAAGGAARRSNAAGSVSPGTCVISIVWRIAIVGAAAWGQKSEEQCYHGFPMLSLCRHWRLTGNTCMLTSSQRRMHFRAKDSQDIRRRSHTGWCNDWVFRPPSCRGHPYLCHNPNRPSK